MAISSPILRLCRPANALTAAADVAAGWCIAGAADWRTLALLAPASMLLYAGGIAFNDVCDAKIDAVERPERPIPSGAISRQAAAALSIGLLLLGVALAIAASMMSEASRHAGPIAAALVVAIVLYDVVLKRHALTGPIGMGACRGLNLMLGVSASAVALGVWWPVAALHVLHIAGVTAMARREAVDKPRRRGVALALAATTLTIFGWVAAGFLTIGVDPILLFMFLVCFGFLTLPAYIAAWRTPQQTNVRAAVIAGVLGLIALDAAIAAGFAGAVYGLVTLALLPLSVWLGRRFAVT